MRVVNCSNLCWSKNMKETFKEWGLFSTGHQRRMAERSRSCTSFVKPSADNLKAISTHLSAKPYRCYMLLYVAICCYMLLYRLYMNLLYYKRIKRISLDFGVGIRSGRRRKFPRTVLSGFAALGPATWSKHLDLRCWHSHRSAKFRKLWILGVDSRWFMTNHDNSWWFMSMFLDFLMDMWCFVVQAPNFLQ